MEETTTESASMRLTLGAEMNDLLLRYKRALKRNTGQTKNKDVIILEILEERKATIEAKLKRLDSDYNAKMKKLSKK